MLDSLQGIIYLIFGFGEESFELDAWQMAARAVVVYFFAILIVRMGNKRFMGRNSAFDLLLGIMLGSVLSRGITGQAPMLGCMAVGAVLLLMHWVLGALAFHFDCFGTFVKGRPRILVRDGKLDKAAMARSHVSRGDLSEALRAHGCSDDPATVSFAALECSGNISIETKKETRIVEIKVADGIQTVRLEIG